MNHHFSSRFYHAARVVSARYPFYLPLAVLLIATLVLRWTNIDLQVSGFFYNAQINQWPLADKNPWEFIDKWCVYPGILLGISALILSSFGLICRQRNRWTQGAFLIAMVFLLGPGLLVNGTMKPAFSRPRPREVVQMGGEQTYEPVFGFGEKTNFNASFPSGHASIGFFLIAPAFLFRRKHRTRQVLLFSGLLFGCIMSLSRIVQGGHYLSDVLWSLGIIYFTAWTVLTLIQTRELNQIGSHHSKTDSTSSKPTMKSAAVKKFAA